MAGEYFEGHIGTGRRVTHSSAHGAVEIGRTGFVEGEAWRRPRPIPSPRPGSAGIPRAACVLEDLGSANGTFVNEERLTAAATLNAGDTFRIGSSTLRVIGPQAKMATTVRDAPPEPLTPSSTDAREVPPEPVAPSSTDAREVLPEPVAPSSTEMLASPARAGRSSSTDFGAFPPEATAPRPLSTRLGIGSAVANAGPRSRSGRQALD